MSDILSGGRIDESTSGPIPSKEDDRKRDILAEQRENQRQDAIGGTEEPPKPRPAEQIPEPPQVAPPLPVVPAFDFSIAGSALEETREVARQTVFDVMRNVTINGQGPSIEGSTISFNIPQQPPASEVFLFQGVAIPQSQIPQIIQPPVIPQPQIQQPEPAQEIQSVVIAPPSRTRAPQVEVVTEEREGVQAPQRPAPVTPPQRLVSAPVELEEPVSVTPPTEVRIPSVRIEAPEIEPQEPTRIPPERVITVPTLEVEIPTVEVSEQRIEEPKVLNIPTISITQPQEEVEQPRIETTPTISVVPPQEEEPVEQPRITTTPSISVTVPQEEAEQPQEPAPQPARSVSVQVPQAEATEAEEPQVPIVSTTQQQPVRLEAPETETTPSIPEASEQPTTQDSVRVVPVQSIDIPPPEPVVTTRLPEQPRGVDSEDFGTGGSSTFLQPAYSEGRLEAADFGTGGSESFLQPAYSEGRLQAEDFGTSGNENFIQPAYSRGRLDAEDFGTARGMEDTSSRDAYAEATERRRERRREEQEADPDFDRESDERQRGESRREYRERQEELKEERAERAEKEAQEKEKADYIKRAREGDITEVPSGLVPVAFTRADGQKKILALLASEFVGIVEGADSGERTTDLPPETDYYEAGGGGGSFPPHPWQIKLRTVPETDPPEYEFKVEAASRLYEGLENWSDIEVSGLNEWFSILDGEYIILNGTVEDGVCTEAEILKTDTLPNRIVFEDDEQTEFNTQIGFIFSQGEQLRVRQNAFHNFTLIQSCVDGNPALYPFAT